MRALRVALPGACGRMGRAIVRAIADRPELELAAAIERKGYPEIGRDAGEVAGVGRIGTVITDDPSAALERADAWIDFTAPEATAAAATCAAEKGVAVVVGTTGLGPDHRAALERASKRVPMVVSANMSIGVNVLARLLEVATRALGPGFDPEIVELHHRHKKDAPSGTALLLAEAIARASGRSLDKTARYGREGIVGERSDEEVGVLAVRGGDVVGDHTAYFLGVGERLELTHRASSRDTFAQGALRAAIWAHKQPPGLYSMLDVLGLKATG